MERGIIVEKQELMFLLSCNGCRTCPAAFLSKADARPAEPEEILKGLFQKGWVKNDQSCFQVQKPLSDAVKQITEAKRVFNFCHGNPERELMFLYPGESLLAVQEIFRRKNAVRMTRVEKNEIFLFLNEQGFTGIDERASAKEAGAERRTQSISLGTSACKCDRRTDRRDARAYGGFPKRIF